MKLLGQHLNPLVGFHVGSTRRHDKYRRALFRISMAIGIQVVVSLCNSFIQ
jgi:hypothetical protein